MSRQVRTTWSMEFTAKLADMIVLRDEVSAFPDERYDGHVCYRWSLAMQVFELRLSDFR